jgi:hypothetical protein
MVTANFGDAPHQIKDGTQLGGGAIRVDNSPL